MLGHGSTFFSLAFAKEVVLTKLIEWSRGQQRSAVVQSPVVHLGLSASGRADVGLWTAEGITRPTNVC
jgi:hypothetical protein